MWTMGRGVLCRGVRREGSLERQGLLGVVAVLAQQTCRAVEEVLWEAGDFAYLRPE